MSKRNNQNQKAALALAMAGGGTVAAWAREHQVAERTARTWSNSTEVLDQVESIRREVLDRAIGRLSDNAIAAADEIARLVKEAASEAVRLQAARAVLAELMTVSNYAALDGRLADIERRIAHAQPADHGPANCPG
jgi:transposase-like protein